jgi:hypothetical protein
MLHTFLTHPIVHPCRIIPNVQERGILITSQLTCRTKMWILLDYLSIIKSGIYLWHQSSDYTLGLVNACRAITTPVILGLLSLTYLRYISQFIKTFSRLNEAADIDVSAQVVEKDGFNVGSTNWSAWLLFPIPY